MWIGMEETILHGLNDIRVDERFTDFLLVNLWIFNICELGGRYVFHHDHVVVRVLFVDSWNLDPVDTPHTLLKVHGILNLLKIIRLTQEILDRLVEDVSGTI